MSNLFKMVLIDRVSKGIYNYYGKNFSIIVDPAYTDLYQLNVVNSAGDILESLEVKVRDFNYDQASEEIKDEVTRLKDRYNLTL